MKALTIWQPYASMIAEGLKEYETRSFRTSHRGPLLIHSGQRPMRWILKHSAEDALDVAIEAFGMEKLMNLPVGCAICVVDLVDCIEMTPEFIAQQSPTELAVGDWKPGRFAWKLENPRELDPVELIGKQGLWNASLCEACCYNIRSSVRYPQCAGCDGVSKYEPGRKWRRCTFCGVNVEPKHEHNPAPVAEGICCAKCNAEIVIPARIAAVKKEAQT